MTLLLARPDPEILVVDFLLDQDEVSDIVTDRVFTEFPKTKVFPAVRVSQFNTLPANTKVRWLETYSLQLDCYGGSKKLARQLAEACADTLESRLVGTQTEGVVTAVSIFGMRPLADETVADKAQPRVLFVANITAHPLPSIGS